MKNIHNEFIYKSKSGNVIWKNNPYVDKKECRHVVNDVLNLNYGALRMIRIIWSFLSEKGMGCNLPEEERRKVIDSLLQYCDERDKEQVLNFKNDNYWSLLEEYR